MVISSSRKYDTYNSHSLRARSVREREARGHCEANSGLVLNHTQSETAQLKAQISKKKQQNSTNVKFSYTQKLIKYGNTIELINYKKRQYTHNNNRVNYEQSKSSSRRNDSLWRTRNTVCQLIQANIDDNPLYKPVFLTLTFKKNVVNIKQANRCFTRFLMRLKYLLNTNPKYISVIEFQKRGSIHYHIVLFNFPFVDKHKIESLWSHGFTNIRTVDKIRSVTRYVGKYMNKELLDSRLVGQKAYFCSRNLTKPQTYYDDETIQDILNHATLHLYEKINNESYTINKYRI